MSVSPHDQTPNTNPRFATYATMLLFAVATFFVGWQLGQLQVARGAAQPAGLLSALLGQPTQPEDVELTDIWRVWELLEDKFAAASSSEPITNESRIEGMISGLVESYDDPYTTYLPPDDAEQFNEDISGNFGGVGMEVGMRNDVITIISPLPNTPAEAAGLAAGDVIVEINGTSTQDMSVDRAVQLIRGEPGTDVVLTIFRSGETEFRDVSVTRDTITIPTIETEQRGDVYIIRLFSFNALAEAEMQNALREYVQSGANKLIFDVRGNPGGYLQSAIGIASYFLPAGKVIVREDFGDERPTEVYRSTGRTLRQFSPEQIVVLINGGSASASEIVTGALQAHDMATVIGEQSFGKGSVQELINLPNKASLKVTIARWLTPDGTSISDGGVMPDIVISRTVEQVLADEDPQLDAALRFLAGEEVVSETEATSTVPVAE
jgi:carboxyl-terminal processing protease